ncbi:MAG: UxaA family hydrolase [Synergistaceae bacterium]|jgi:hypothetical protein|nr:UxaA family hydrolase [Synergistaceae bacterium]
MLRKSLMINPMDSVVMVLEDAKKGDSVVTPKGTVTLVEDVEFAHKASISDMKKGQPVIKYGEEIGYLLKDVSAGSWIHVHNMGCDRGKI